MLEADALRVVLEVIREEAPDLEYEHLRDPHADTPLYGGPDGVDSLSLVRLIVAVETAAHARD